MFGVGVLLQIFCGITGHENGELDLEEHSEM